MQGLYKRKRTLHKWIISYLVVLGIPLLFGILIYEYALYIVREEVDTVQYQALMRIQDSLEHVVETCERLGLSVVSSEEAGILRRMEGRDGYTPEQLLSTKALTGKLSQHFIANDQIERIVVYFPETGYVLLKDLFCPLDWTIESEQSKYGMKVERIKALTAEKKRGLFLSEEEELFYFFSNSSGKNSQPEAVVFVYLDMVQIKRMMSIPEATLFLSLSDDGYFPLREETESAEKLVRKRDSYELSSGKGYYEMNIQSQKYEIGLISRIPKGIYEKKLHRLLWILAGYILCCLIGGGIGSWCLSKRNYRPLEELLELIRAGSDKDNQKKRAAIKRGMAETDEFTMIRTAYQDLRAANQDKDIRLRIKKRKEQNDRMNELLTGRGKNHSLEREGESVWNQPFLYQGFVVICVDISDFGMVFLEEKTEVSSEILDMAYFTVKNVLHELLGGSYSCVEAETEGRLFALLNVKEEETDPQFFTDLKEICTKASQFIWEHYFMKLQISISSLQKGYERIPQCYEEIREIREYRSYYAVPDEVIISREELLELEGARATEEEGRTEKKQEEKKKKERLEGIQIQAAVDQAASYIEEHYTDNMLSAGMLADKFQVGISYLSRSFKKQRGIGMLDYINQLRMEYAKKLLTEGYSVQEAAEKVGFFTAQPLVRIFRQWEGMTPGEYKKQQEAVLHGRKV